MTLTGDEAVLANRIRTIDRDLDSLEQSIKESVIFGLHNSGAAIAANLTQASANKQKEALLAERAEIVTKLKAAVVRS